MQPLARFGILCLSCVVLAVVASPWAYLGMQWLAEHTSFAWVDYLARHPFHRYFNRIWQASLVVGILCFWRQLGFGSFRDLGLGGGKVVSHLAFGFISSVVLMSLYVGATVLLGWREIRGAPPKWAINLLMILGTASVVSILEEIFFRGYFYRISKKGVGVVAAVVLNLLVFSLIHYVKPEDAEKLRNVGAFTGVHMLQLALSRFASPMDILGGVLVLMAAAAILCWSVEKTGRLYLAIGLHAGWIFALQFLGLWTHNLRNDPKWVYGGGDLSQGALALLPLTVQFAVLALWLKRAKSA